jgi:hypothetical protein
MCGKENKQGCRKPENLKGSPGNCSPEQIRACHGETAGHPCVETAACERPERLKGKPGECSSAQVRQCHGDTAGHPCAGK